MYFICFKSVCIKMLPFPSQNKYFAICYLPDEQKYLLLYHSYNNNNNKNYIYNSIHYCKAEIKALKFIFNYHLLFL